MGRRILAGLLRRIAGRRIGTIIAKGHDEDLVRLKDLAEAGKLTPVIERRYPLSQLPEAIRYVETYQARGKVVIYVGQVSACTEDPGYDRAECGRAPFPLLEFRGGGCDTRRAATWAGPFGTGPALSPGNGLRS